MGVSGQLHFLPVLPSKRESLLYKGVDLPRYGLDLVDKKDSSASA
jgi:hypothetical protein